MSRCHFGIRFFPIWVGFAPRISKMSSNPASNTKVRTNCTRLDRVVGAFDHIVDREFRSLHDPLPVEAHALFLNSILRRAQIAVGEFKFSFIPMRGTTRQCVEPGFPDRYFVALQKAAIVVVQAKALIVIYGKTRIVLTQHENVCVFNDNSVGYIGRPTACALGSKGR